MKRLLSNKFLLGTLCLVVLGASGFFFLVYDPYASEPNDPRYQEILRDIRAAQPAAVNVSPNGDYVLTKEETEHGFTLSIQDAKSSKVLQTHFSENSQMSLTWRPDAQALVFQELSGMNRPLYRLDLKSGQKKKIHAPVSRTALPPLRWNPNGKHLAYFHGDWREGNLLVIEPEKDVEPLILKKSFAANCDFVWSPDGNSMAVATSSEPGVINFISLKDLNSRPTTVDKNARIDNLAWSPDGRYLLAVLRNEGDEYAKLVELAVPENFSSTSQADWKGNQGELRAVEIGDIKYPLWLPDGRSFIYHVLSDGILRAVMGSRDQPAIKTIGPTNGMLRVTHINPKGTVAYGRFASLSRPPELMQIAVETGSSETLYSPPQTDLAQCPVPQFIRLKSYDGTLIPAYHWKARSSEAPSGVLIEVHGGFHLQTFPTWESYLQVLTKNGWDVIAVNYRGSSGYGRKFEDMGDGEEGLQQGVMDVVAARDYAVNSLKVPPQKICLMGSSRGSGFVAAAAAYGEVGGLALISWIGPLGNPGLDGKKIIVRAFQGASDPFMSPRQARRSIIEFLNPASNAEVEMRWHTCKNEGHSFSRADSWSRICWEVLLR